MSKDDLLFKISEDIGCIKTKVDTTNSNVSNIQSQIKTMSDDIRGNHERWILDKEEIYDRLKPLEEDYKKRCAFTSDVKKKGWDIVWDWVKVAVVFVAGYLLTIIKK